MGSSGLGKAATLDELLSTCIEMFGMILFSSLYIFILSLPFIQKQVLLYNRIQSSYLGVKTFLTDPNLSPQYQCSLHFLLFTAHN